MFQYFNVVVTNGSAIVKAVHSIVIDREVSEFTAGEALRWDTTKFGDHISSLPFVLRIIKDVGVTMPAIGDTISGDVSGATAIVVNINTLDNKGIPINPPNFDSNFLQEDVTAGDVFRIIQAGAADQYGIIHTTINDDNFTLTENWAGETLFDFPAFISQDFTTGKTIDTSDGSETTLKLELPTQGSPQPISIIRRAINQVSDHVSVRNTWTEIATFESGASAYTSGDLYPLQVMLDQYGWFHLRGAVTTTTTLAYDLHLFTLPAQFRPEHGLFFTLHGSTGSDDVVHMHLVGLYATGGNAGKFNWFGGELGAGETRPYIYFDGVHFQVGGDT